MDSLPGSPAAVPALPVPAFVGRGGEKLAWALGYFGVNPAGRICADLGSNIGGFVDALLAAGAVRVYSVDTSRGALAWKLRNDSRVVVLERVNALHVRLSERVDLVSIDVGWTRQHKILPRALSLLAPGGEILSLVKPQYEARPDEIVRGAGRVKPEALERIEAEMLALAESLGGLVGWARSPFVGGKGGNPEFFLRLRP